MIGRAKYLPVQTIGSLELMSRFCTDVTGFLNNLPGNVKVIGN